jgi:site-specific recombinase XerD
MLDKYVAAAHLDCPSLKEKRVTPHVLRHTTAMEMLQAGIDRSMIALWLGHESVATTQIYLHADLSMKRSLLEKTKMPESAGFGTYLPDDRLLAFLRNL